MKYSYYNLDVSGLYFEATLLCRLPYHIGYLFIFSVHETNCELSWYTTNLNKYANAYKSALSFISN